MSRRRHHEEMRVWAKVAAEEVLTARREEREASAAIYDVAHALQRVANQLEAHDLPRLAAVQAPQDAVSALRQRMADEAAFREEYGRLPRGFDGLYLMGVSVEPLRYERAGCVRLVPESVSTQAIR